MRILFVAMPDSIHTARWISQVTNQGWEVYLYPVYKADPHPSLRNITLFDTHIFRPASLDISVEWINWPSIRYYLDYYNRRFKHQYSTKPAELSLKKVIKLIKPDIVHSLEFQHAGYMTLNVKKQFGEKFPTWIATNWGSDLYLFGRLLEHQHPIREILEKCDYYSCECQRDVEIAQKMGLKSPVLPVLPNAGGIKVDQAVILCQDGPVSKRKYIIIKGYQGWAGRAFVALQALRFCQDILQGYTLIIFNSGEDTTLAARLFSDDTGIPVEIIPSFSSHEEILRQFGESRIYIGLSISDAISTSLLEAMVMGAFPIQSCTACADEWIENGATGFIVPPEDPQKIAEAIRDALTDDKLVDQAAEINLGVARKRLDYEKIQTQVIEMYQNILSSRN